ncbi:MAG: ABC transporter ATP-binding protein/permease [Cohaesibacter sp.]|nr:ABC transporter ATP-binding protein/permease [Cohaesibacter sp.]
MEFWKKIFPTQLSDGNRSVDLIKRLLSENFRQYASRYALAFVFMALVAGMTSLSAWIMRDVVNEIFVDKDLSRTIMISLAVFAIFVIKGVATYGQNIVLGRIGNAIVARHQKLMYARILKQDATFFQKYISSDLITRISHNAQAARDVLTMLVTSIGRDLLSLIGLIIVMVVQDPIMSFIAFFIAPPAIYGVARLVKRTKKIAKAEYLSLTKIVLAMQETALGYRIIRTFGLQDIMRERMEEAVHGVEHKANKINSISARTSPLMETLGGVAFALVILYSGWQTIEAGKSPGEFISFLTALLLAYEPAKRISRLQVRLEAGLVGVGLMFEILDSPLSVTNSDNTKMLDLKEGEIILENVSFEYIKENPALNDLSLSIPGGKITALVGPSGSGKSTLLNLIQREYDPGQGRLLLDGQDIRQVGLEDLNSYISLVTQDTVLFTGSIKDNIAYGRHGASDDEIIQAAKDAYAHDFIEGLPDGYDTIVGENGASLSGGQKQRIAIARAIIKNAPIILLDEATSALDSESEAKIQKAFERLMEGKTTVIIAHRLATIQHAHSIAVIKDGTLIEQGSHEHLIEKSGFYAHLVQLQFGS